jgi:TM2 domain-containing membrane protein YozV
MNAQNMNNQNMNYQNMNNQNGAPAQKEKMVAGLLGIFLGSLGIHKFYLGYTTEAIIMLAVTLVGGFISLGLVSGIMGIIGLVEGIIYLTKSDDDFQQTYVYNHKGWF